MVSFESFLLTYGISLFTFFEYCDEWGKQVLLQHMTENNSRFLRIIFLFNFEENPIFTKERWIEINKTWTHYTMALGSDTVPLFRNDNTRREFYSGVDAQVALDKSNVTRKEQLRLNLFGNNDFQEELL